MALVHKLQPGIWWAGGLCRHVSESAGPMTIDGNPLVFVAYNLMELHTV